MFFGLNDVAFLAAVGRPPAVSDSDAEAYLQAVETADGNFLEVAVRTAVNDFVVGCKTDGIWNAIKASCILAGARTLTGALVPLVGAAPTNVGGLFVAGDYNRKTGLVGDGSTKYLDSNRNSQADPKDSYHLAIQISQVGTGLYFGGSTVGSSGATTLSTAAARCRNPDTDSVVPVAGFAGLSRSSSADYTFRNNSASSTITRTSAEPLSQNAWIYRNAGFYGNHRLAFYSIGESLDLALLDARVTALINAIAAAIP